MTTSKKIHSCSCTLVVMGWDQTTAWFPGMGGYVEKLFMRSLQLSTPMSHAEAKNVVKKIAAREIFEVFLADDCYAYGMCHALESIGGQVSLQRSA
ncbi:hypothetical protein FSY59_03180 [Comamonas sp. Z3]|uniref:hypothetical protein n=1 Tax=Comamonas sp. Z3 TaxID=2601247 RepID=UPI0011E7A77F|nr:hypothetical protein [Comamonas sp. Z3]TYK73615.1 hypothetical protein FSY59_03180 [Comamonas sp. Z3]